jgi:hypothetical protein
LKRTTCFDFHNVTLQVRVGISNCVPPSRITASNLERRAGCLREAGVIRAAGAGAAWKIIFERQKV